MALNPFLFIGVGGTGGKTIGVIRSHLLNAVKAVGWTELPRGWQFLHIDVPADPDAKTEGLPYSLPRSEYLGLTVKTSTFVNISSGISDSLSATGRERYLAWDSWRPYPPESVRVIISEGAGQFRGVGRVASQNALKGIDAAISRALSAITDPTTQGELRNLQRARGAQVVDMATGTTNVMVVGSVAGGSGSGMLLDVCDIVRAQGVQALSAVVFTPEVFTSEQGRTEPGVAPNTFGAINELSNAMWASGVRGESSRDTLFRGAGISRALGLSGPGTVFLVGRSSGTITLSEPEEVYAVVGNSLANVALSEQLTNDLGAYVRNNMQARTVGLADNLRLSAPASRDLGQFSALGFGRVALGRDYFERYASQRLTRLAVERLLDRHLLLHYPGDGKTDEQVLKEAADRVWNSFVNGSSINEEGDDHNDIIDALDPLAKIESALMTFQSTVAQELMKQAGSKKLDTNTARATAADMVLTNKSAENGIPAKARTEITQTIPSWAKATSDTLREIIVAMAAQEGLPVVLELLDRLIAHSERGVVEIRDVDLRRAKEKLRARHTFLAAGSPTDAKQVKADNPLLTDIAKQARLTLESEIHAQTLTIVAEVLADLVENLLKPWQRAVKNADELLRGQARPAQSRSPLEQMPGKLGVPTHLRPSRVEYLLDDIEAFPQTFVEEVGYSAGEDVDTSSGEGLAAAIEEVVRQIIVADRLNPLGRPVKRPATYDQYWVPEYGARRAPARAIVLTAFGMTDLEERVFAWLHDDRKQVGRYLRESLIDYVAAPTLSEAQSLRNQDRLVNQFEAALRVSAPLVQLDSTMVQLIHNQATPPRWLKMSPISIPDHLTELRTRLEDAAITVVGPGKTPTFTTHPVDGVTILTSFDNPYHPLEFTSVMEPIASQWMANHTIPDFWLWRRTAPLPEWVPLSPNSLSCLLRGWFAARFLGRATFVSTPEGGHFEVYVDNATGGHWARIDLPGMRPKSRHDHVANLIEAVPLAMLDAFHVRSLAPLAPFQALISLGATLGTDQDPVRRWVTTGDGLIDPKRAYCPDAEDRGQELVTMCDTLIKSHGQRSTEINLADPAKAQTEPRHEIYADVVHALTALKGSATVIEDDDPL